MIDQNAEQDYIEQDQDDHPGTGLAVPDQRLPQKLYLLPITNRPFFPAQVMPVVINETPWAETIERVAATPHHVLSLFWVDQPMPADGALDPELLPKTGCAVKVHQAVKEWWKWNTPTPPAMSGMKCVPMPWR